MNLFRSIQRNTSGIVWLVLFAVVPALSAAELEDRLFDCTQLRDDHKRLGCFDKLVQSHGLTQADEYIEPAEAFLDSQLRISEDESEFSLNIRAFVHLIETAKMDSGKVIKIYGWKKHDNQYILMLGMRSLTRVVFEHDRKANFSLLNPVRVDGSLVDPSLFVLNIAAMVPDE